MAALKSATTWIQDNAEAHWKILICTDSNALCQALLNPKPGEIATLKRELEKSPGEVHVKWVPAHVLIDGNEVADRKAKEATRLNTTPRAASYQAAKKLIRRNVIDPPIQHEQTREVYKQYRLKNDEQLKTRADQKLIAKIRTGHWKKFREFKSRVDGGKTDPNCKFCPGKPHNLRHWMTDCNATDAIRQRLFGTKTPGLKVLATEPEKVVQMSRICQF